MKSKKDEFYSGLMVDVFDNITAESNYKKRANQVIRIIQKYNSKARKILEVACGTGNFTKQLAKENFIIKATDISRDAVQKAKTKGINAIFNVADMTTLNSLKSYDVVCCFWESFRYLHNYKVAQNTLKRISKSLKNNGLFFVDFTAFPAHNKPFKIPTYTIKLGNGLIVLKETYILTKGNLDTRWSKIQYKLNGKDVTGQKITWCGKTVFLKPTLYRSPLLRITREKMEKMLIGAGFIVLQVKHGFAGCPESMLFIAQKKSYDFC